MHMHLNTRTFSNSAALTMGVVYVVCAAFVALFPDLALQLLGWLVHLVNVDKFAGDVAMTWAGFVGGLIQVLLYTWVGAYLFAWLHNRSVK